MYRINRSSNSIQRLEKKSFSGLGFREREHLQEWIAKQPDVLGEDLLIIQKEFSGFNDTQERLDLLALDKQGALVIIENKLDDSGRDVTWQALKYASYCSGLSKSNIANIYQQYLDRSQPGTKAEDLLSEFFDNQDFADITLNKGVTQRIMLIAANFRKEVTSTVLWLLNFKVRLQCFRATPYAMGDELFLNVQQIIPTQDTEEYMIGMAEKAQDDIEDQVEQKHRHIIRREFWGRVIEAMNETPSSLYQSISPGDSSWIGAGSGVGGIGLHFVATRQYGRAELYIDRPDKADNEYVFGQLLARKEEIEKDFGGPLEWEPLEGRKASRIKAEAPGNIFERENWDSMVSFMVDAMFRLERAIKGPLREVWAVRRNQTAADTGGQPET